MVASGGDDYEENAERTETPCKPCQGTELTVEHVIGHWFPPVKADYRICQGEDRRLSSLLPSPRRDETPSTSRIVRDPDRGPGNCFIRDSVRSLRHLGPSPTRAVQQFDSRAPQCWAELGRCIRPAYWCTAPRPPRTTQAHGSVHGTRANAAGQRTGARHPSGFAWLSRSSIRDSERSIPSSRGCGVVLGWRSHGR